MLNQYKKDDDDKVKKQCIDNPNVNELNLIVDVWGSLEATELLRVYITNMAVMETGMLVLKCSLLKNKVAWKNIPLGWVYGVGIEPIFC